MIVCEGGSKPSEFSVANLPMAANVVYDDDRNNNNILQ